jgi:hypothetical protein
MVLVKIELELKLIRETVNSSGNTVKYYEAYSLDGTTYLGTSILSAVISTTPSVAVVAGSSGSATSSNSDSSDLFIHYNRHTVLEIDGQLYVFNHSWVVNKNNFIELSKPTALKGKFVGQTAMEEPAVTVTAQLSSTNNYGVDNYWTATEANGEMNTRKVTYSTQLYKE